jgi:photosystem II stability/assembly factor-like uncharacterized protein
MISLILACVLGFLPPGESRSQAYPGWDKQVSGTTEHVTNVSAGSATTAWASGYKILLKTTDGGQNWVKQMNLPMEPFDYIQDIDAVGAQTLWVLCQSGAICRTKNGGTSWSKKQIPQMPGSTGTSCHAITALSDSTALGIGVCTFESGGVFYDYEVIGKTVNDGDSWTLQYQKLLGPQPTDAAVYPSSISSAGSNAIYAVKYKTVVKSTDGGVTWSTIRNVGPNTLVLDISCVDKNTAWLFEVTPLLEECPNLVSSSVLRTIDGGASWKSVLETGDAICGTSYGPGTHAVPIMPC